jgi:hypothetical protein
MYRYIQIAYAYWIDLFFTIYQTIANEGELIEKFRKTYILQCQVEENVKAFKKSLEDIVNEIGISSTIKGFCNRCPRKI